jgi:hypothetical protein
VPTVEVILVGNLEQRYLIESQEEEYRKDAQKSALKKLLQGIEKNE